MQVLYPLSLFAVFCAISSADTQESIDAEPTVQISKEAIAAVVQKPVIDSAHRHSMNQLEPDLAKTIFDVGKNPLQRTTTLPSQQLVDSRSTSELKRDRRQAVPKVIGVAEVRRFTEYDVINSDFSTDDEPVHIMPVNQKIDGSEEFILENATTAVGLPDHDIVEIVDNEKNETDESTSGGTSDVSLTELKPSQKGQDTHKQLFDKIHKEAAANTDSIIDQLDFSSDPFATKIDVSEEGSGDAEEMMESFSTSSTDSSSTTTTVGTIVTGEAAPTSKAPPLVDGMVQKRRVLLTNYVNPEMLKLIRVRRADNEDFDLAPSTSNFSPTTQPPITSISTTTTTTTTTAAVKHNQFRLISSGERDVVDRNLLKVERKLVPASSQTQPPLPSSVGALDDFFKDLPSAADKDGLGVDFGATLDHLAGVGSRETGSSNPASPSIGSRPVFPQPPQGAQPVQLRPQPPPVPAVQYNHYVIGRRRFVIKSIPVEHHIQQQQQLLYRAQQPQQPPQAPPQTLVEPIPFGASFSQALPFAAPPARNITDGDVSPTATGTAVNAQRATAEQLNVIRTVVTTTPAVVVTTKRPVPRAHVKVADGDVYDELAPPISPSTTV